MKHKNTMDVGMSQLLKSPASPMTREGLNAYREMKKASGLSTHEMLDYLGEKSKLPRTDTDKVKQEKRLDLIS